MRSAGNKEAPATLRAAVGCLVALQAAGWAGSGPTWGQEMFRLEPVAAFDDQARGGFHLTEAFADREEGWNDHRAELWFAAGAFRLDVWTPQHRASTRMSLIIPPGERDFVVLLLHGSRTFDECAIEGLAGAGDAYRTTSWPLGDAPSSIIVTPSDAPRRVGRWETSAVELTRPGQPDPVARLWLGDVDDIGLAELRRTLVAGLHPYGPSGATHSMWLMLVAGMDDDLVAELPSGIPVALELARLGELGATSEIQSIERAALDPALFAVPPGYMRDQLCSGR